VGGEHDSLTIFILRNTSTCRHYHQSDKPSELTCVGYERGGSLLLRLRHRSRLELPPASGDRGTAEDASAQHGSARGLHHLISSSACLYRAHFKHSS